jgi:hypothetical protein
MDKNRFSPQGNVKVIQGSILTPHMAGLRIIVNTANLAGKTENALYPIFDKKWKQVKTDVKGWFNTKTGAYQYGKLLSTATQSDVWVVSMLCQDKELKTDVKGLELCLKELCKMAKSEQASVHISTLLSGSIPELAELVKLNLVENGVNVNYYEEK